MSLRMEGGDPAMRELFNDLQNRLDRSLAAVADMQRRIENLERYCCGGQEQVAEAAAKIVVDPPHRKGLLRK